ncbi:hypothetical protein KQH29_00825 [bacterium]|nr:hypothetical protein [bacterium]
MNEQCELTSKPLKNGRHEAFAQSCLSMSQAEAYRAHYPASRRWKPSSVQEAASKLAAKVSPRIQWLRNQAADKSIADLIEAKRTATAIMRDGEARPLDRLAAIDRLARLEGWDKPQQHVIMHKSIDDMTDGELRVLLG